MVYQIGARRHFAVARGLHDNNALLSLHVDAAANSFPWNYLGSVPKLRNLGFVRSVTARRVSGVPTSLISGHFSFVVRNMMGRAAAKNLSASERWVRQNRLFCNAMTRTSWRNADAVYAYNGAALEIFQRAKADGKRCILDQTAAPWRWNTALLTSERDKWPNWEPTPGDLDTSGAMIAREEQEWELADRIICGSQFVVDRISEINGPTEKCRVVPYPMGNSTRAASSHASTARKQTSKPYQVLFVGTLQLRKGVPYLVDALQYLPNDQYQFRLVGPNLLTADATQRIRDAGIEVIGSVPRDAVDDEYTRADVFVLPTLSEGSANVCHEAIAAGLPVITTPAAGIAAHPQVTIVPAQDAAALASAIKKIAQQERPRLEHESTPVRTVKEYGKELLEAIRE